MSRIKSDRLLVDNFFAWVSMYELTRQWLTEDGEFQYQFGWLTSKFSDDEIKRWVDEIFNSAMDFHPDSFELISLQVPVAPL